ncbi:hypothetical protein CCR75_002255 [Bremia lactucae]|uniref:Pseudouridine synthase I TruA alpha/beta domain-containing protein n=1 Tax=Bremia lactucae TaxID=4779 RepID=A0A976FMW1_BRELC|nr:hypothetical protein CCR75_002255 [Bremia lactucae]
MLLRYASHPAARTALRSTFCRRIATASDVANDTMTGQHCVDQANAASTKLVKRKVAIVGGFMGCDYYGLQLNDNVKTIEDEIRRAILKAGAMRDSNFENLNKIGWARSSRTDKGVHAGCIVFSGKLLIDEENSVDPISGRVVGLKDALNASLPENIRVFSCTRVNKSFSARKNCVLREYEYFLPLSFLKKSMIEMKEEDFDIDSTVAEFCLALRRYEGVHDFHNFTRSRSYFYKVQEKKKLYKAPSRSEAEVEALDDGEITDEGTELDEPVPTDSYNASSQFEDEEGLTRKPLNRHRRSIYSCSGSLVTNFHSEPHLRVRIVGQAFLLNQIRCMIGGALAVATKGLSRVMFDAALNATGSVTRYTVRVPIAPAEGLVLLSCSFGGKLHTVSLHEDSNTHLAKERKDLKHRILLNSSEDDEMRKFREEVIYKQVGSSWKMEDEVIDRWRIYLERCYEANKRLDEKELAAMLYELDLEKVATKNKNQAFVKQNRIDLAETGRQGALLPKQFSTQLCLRYSVAPGIFTADLRRAVTHHLKAGKILLGADEHEIMTYIDNYGPENLAREGRNLRLSIQSSAQNRD